MEEIRAFKIKIHPLARYEFIEIISKSIKEGNKIIQNGVNAASVNEIADNEDLRRVINQSDLVNIDGMSVVWALRYIGFKVPERVACPDLANDVLEEALKNDFTVFLFGASQNSIIGCVKNLKTKYPGINIAGYRNGYFNESDEPEIIKTINDVDPDILFLGMPTPRKEFFIDKYRKQLNVRYVLGVGGYFDILAGLTKRAPYWMQRTGLEWLYRFMQEPRRMWQRYMVGNLKFIRRVFREKYAKKRD